MYQRILVPLDGSASASRVLDEAIRLARLTGAQLRLLHVVDGLSFASGMEFTTADVLGMLLDAGAQLLAEAKARVEAAGIPVTTHLPETFGERVCDAVIAQAQRWQADLIVLGTHGRRGIGRLLLGSDAEQIVRLAPVPVLLVRLTPNPSGVAAPAAGGAAMQPPIAGRA